MFRCLRASIAVVACTSALACAGQTSPAEAPPEAEPPAADEAAPPPAPAERPEVTADECTARGGTVVGDIGDGAIHRPDYRCPSGAEPIGSIRAADDGPVAVEGSVCCPS